MKTILCTCISVKRNAYQVRFYFTKYLSLILIMIDSCQDCIELFFQNKKVVFGFYFHLPVASSPTHDHTDILYLLLLFLTTFAKIEFSYNFIDLMYFQWSCNQTFIHGPICYAISFLLRAINSIYNRLYLFIFEHQQDF